MIVTFGERVVEGISFGFVVRITILGGDNGTKTLRFLFSCEENRVSICELYQLATNTRT